MINYQILETNIITVALESVRRINRLDLGSEMASCLVLQKCPRKAILRLSTTYAYFAHVHVHGYLQDCNNDTPGVSAYTEEIVDLCAKQCM